MDKFMVEISTNSEGAELFHEGVSKKCIHVMSVFLGGVLGGAHNTFRESTCIWSGHMPNTPGTATIAFINMAKSFHFYQIVTSRP